MKTWIGKILAFFGLGYCGRCGSPLKIMSVDYYNEYEKFEYACSNKKCKDYQLGGYEL